MHCRIIRLHITLIDLLCYSKGSVRTSLSSKRRGLAKQKCVFDRHPS